MSASPQPTQSAKRPLEETSSPSVADQPEAKRPALDKTTKDQEELKEPIAASNGDTTAAAAPAAPAPASEADDNAKTNGEKPEVRDAQGDTVVPDAPETKPIASTASGSASQAQSNPPPAAHDETSWIHIRAVISSPEAATIIGKGGENVSKIRQMSGAKCTVSDYQKGAVERILTVSGIVDAVAKVRMTRMNFSGPPKLSRIAMLTHASGFWSDHPDAQQRAVDGAVEPALQDVPASASHPSYPHRLHHWQGRCADQGNPGGLRCPPKRV